MSLQILAPIHFANSHLQRWFSSGPFPKGRGPQTSQVEVRITSVARFDECFGGDRHDDLHLGAGRNYPSIWRGESKFLGCGDGETDDTDLAR